MHRRRTTSWRSRNSCDARNYRQSPWYGFGRLTSKKVRELAETVSISTDRVHFILHNELRIHRYHASTKICTGSVLALLRSRFLADTWSQDSGRAMPVPRQPSARYRLSSTSIAPCLQLARYCAVCKYWHESDFSTWECVPSAGKVMPSAFAIQNKFSSLITLKRGKPFLENNRDTFG